jgi:molecular chaperone DnaK
MQTEVNLPFITADASGPEASQHQADPRQAGAAWSTIWCSGRSSRRKALKDAGVKASEIDEVILVGGMTRMPKIIET